MDVTVALVTVKVVLEETLPEAAVMMDVPAANPMASPGAPFTLMLATVGFPEVHCTEPVMFSVLPSVKVPVAVNCNVVPGAIEGAGGVIVMDCKTALGYGHARAGRNAAGSCGDGGGAQAHRDGEPGGAVRIDAHDRGIR